MTARQQPIHGNYHAYYSSRFDAVDPRVSLLSPDLFKGKRVLDIGCNEGWLTVDIAQRFAPSRIIGVDIDGDLIRRAWKRRKLMWSLQRPPVQHTRAASSPPSEQEQRGESKRHKKRKRMDSQEDEMNEDFVPAEPSYFPLAMEHMFGSIPFPPAPNDPSKSTSFPHNITFYTADWTKSSADMDDQGSHGNSIGAIEKEDKEGYDVILAFSITKWIHLHGQDDGLRAFFCKIYSVLRPGGMLLLEPQDWEGYAKAKKLDSILMENYKALQLRPSDFPHVLSEIGFVEKDRHVTAGESTHKRSIWAFRKP